jgi:predicted phosphoadenosine phosphosulfate sulfurtransferase
MAIQWMHSFIVPLIEIVFIGGILLFITYYVFRGLSNAWSKSVKFILKFQILRNTYPEKTVKWIVECIDKQIDWYEAKKLLLLKTPPLTENQINEIMFIYDKIVKTLMKEKGGIKSNGRNTERSNQSHESKYSLPSL